MNIIKEKNEMGTFDIRIEESIDKHLDIVFGDDGDIYWILDNYEVVDLQDDPMYDTFMIFKKDYDIYQIFNELYEDLINGRIYHPEQLPSYCLMFDKRAQEKENKRCDESNKEIQNNFRYKKLVNNNVITWYSDEEQKCNAEILRISKKEDYILLEFIRQTKKDEQGHIRLPGWYSIRIRLDGSTYTPCENVFWRHFDNLQKYEPNICKHTNNLVKKLMP